MHQQPVYSFVTYLRAKLRNRQKEPCSRNAHGRLRQGKGSPPLTDLRPIFLTRELTWLDLLSEDLAVSPAALLW